MSIGQLSFWQQNYNWRIEQQRWSDQFSNSGLVTSVLTGALQNQSTGLASIANQLALTRVTKQLKAAATAALGSTTQTSQLKSTASSLAASKSSNSSSGQSLNLLA